MKLVLIFWVVTAVYAAGSRCPLGWEEFRDSCYSVGTETVTWIDAQSYCRLDGGYLVEINDSTENSWLVNVMKGKSLTVVWTGGSERNHRGSWEWATSRTPFGRYHDWFGTDPNGEAIQPEISLCYESENENCRVNIGDPNTPVLSAAEKTGIQVTRKKALQRRSCETDDCLALNSVLSYRWDDISCTLSYRFICESNQLSGDVI